MHHPRVLVVTSCTGKKRFKPENQLKLEDFKDPIQLQSRESELQEFACFASQMYTGQQHLRVMEGAFGFRDCGLGTDSVTGVDPNQS